MHCTELMKPHLIDYDNDEHMSFFLLLVVALPNL